MKILFLTIGGFSGINDHSIYTDLLREFARHGHEVYVVCSEEKRTGKDTWLATEEVLQIDDSGAVGRTTGRGSVSQDAGSVEVARKIPAAKILHVRIGNITKTNIIEKGVSTVMIGRHYMAAIKHHFADVHFDLIMYSTPPITLAGVVESLKKKYNARTYLLLKDIFPQNAVDIGMMSKTGLKAPLYRHFRKQEKKLYAVSDRIGCMSPANVRYVLEHNPEVQHGIVEVCPNSIGPQDMSLPESERMQLRRVYGIPEDRTVFIYGGNLGRPQGIDFMLRCLHAQRKNKKAFFFIVGSGTEFDRIRRYIEKYGDKGTSTSSSYTGKPVETPHSSGEYRVANIVLHESLPKADYDSIVLACDVGMIFLDHRFTIPNFPSRLLSYMQARVPVLALTDPNTDVGEVITGRASGIDMEPAESETTLEAEQAIASDHAAGSQSAESGTTSEAEQAVSIDHSPFGWWAESSDVRTASSLIKKISHMDHHELSTMGNNGYDYMISNYDVRDAYETIMKRMKGQ